MNQTPTFAPAFGQSGKRVTLAGREIVVRYLDINDLIDIEQRLGTVDGLDQTNFSHLRFLFWLILRKGDPVLSEADLLDRRYTLTESEAGVGLTARLIKSEAFGELIRDVMIGSGLIDDPDAPDEGDDPNATAAASK